MAGYNNTFENLMHQDTEKTFQPKGTYYELRNARAILRQDGSLAIQSPEGTQLIAKLDRQNFKIIGAFSDGDSKIYVHSTADNTTSGGDGEIGRFDISFSTAGFIQATYTPIYYHEDLKYSQQYPISPIANIVVEESPNTNRNYWSDNFNYPRVINYSSERLEQLDGATILNGETYQVVRGTVTYGAAATVYGPGQVAGNTFNGVSGYANVTSKSSDAILIKHIEVTDLRWTPPKDAGEIYCSGVGSGSVLCGSYMAFYALVSSEGYVSPYGYSTLPIHVFKSTGSTFQDYQESQGDESTVNSGKSIKLTINNIDQGYEKVRIVLVRFVGNEIFDLPAIHAETAITGSEMEIEITSNATLGTLTVNQLKEILTIFKTVGTFAHNKNRVIAGDVELTGGLEDWEPGDVGYEWFDYETPGDHHMHSDVGTAKQWSGLEKVGSSISSGEIVPNVWYEVSGDASNYVTYNGNVYYPGHSNGAYFQGVTSVSGAYDVAVKAFTPTGSPTVYMVIRIANFNGNYRYYRIQDEFPDLKSEKISSLLRSYRRGREKYRIGIVPLSPEGSPMFGHMLFDVVTPETYDYPLTTKFSDTAADDDEKWNLRHLGLRIGTPSKPLDLSDWEGKASAFMIVRAERVPKCIATGISIPCLNNNAAAGSQFSSEAAIRTRDDNNESSGGLTENVSFMLSPEYLFGHPDTAGQFSDLKAKIRYWATDVNAVSNLDTTNMKKMFSSTSQHSANYWKYIDKAGNVTGFDGFEVDVDTIYPADVGEVVTVPGISKSIQTYTAYNKNQAGTFRTTGLRPRGHVLYHGDDAFFTSPASDTDTRRALIDIIVPENESVDYGDPAQTQWILCGNIIKLDDTTKTANGGNFIFDGIEVFGGDVYVNMFNCQKSITITGANPTSAVNANGIGLTVSFPVESKINIAMRRGRHGFRDGNYISAVTGNGVSGAQPENFIIDEHYLSENVPGYTFSNLPEDFTSVEERYSAIYLSDPKIVGELNDNFRRFPALNERFMEITNGKVTALIRDEGKLFCWQEGGVLYLPMEEPSAVGTNIGEAVYIGVGGIIDRYDERTEHYGLQDRFGIKKLDDGFLWCDVRKGKMLYMDASGKPIKIAVIRGVNNYITEFLRGSDIQANPRTSNPMTGYGICIGYDERYDEAYVTFHTQTTSKTSFTIGINMLKKAFTAFYDWTPAMYIEHNNMLFGVPDSQYTEYTSPGIGSAGNRLVKGDKFVFVNGSGERTIYRVNAAEYISDGTETNPSTISEISRMGQENFLWMFGSQVSNNYNLAKYFGEVITEKVHIIVNAASEEYKKFKAIELMGSGDNPFDIIFAGTGVKQLTNYNKVQFVTREHDSGEVLTSTFMRQRRGGFIGPVQRDNNRRYVDINQAFLPRRMRGLYLEVIFTHDHNDGKSSLTSGDLAYSDDTDAKPLKIVSLFTTFDADVVKQK